jgi:hypothetical protein
MFRIAPAKAASTVLAAVLTAVLLCAAGAPSAQAATVPVMSVSGHTVSWTAVSGATSYVFVRKVPGQADQYSTVTGTSQTPAVVAGRTVTFGVRVNVTGSAWAREVSIAYPATPPPATGAPTLTVSGQSLRWTAVSGVSSYVFSRRVDGETVQTSVVSGTSTTPPAAPGKTVHFTVRTNVSGSPSSNAVSITYPATPPPPASSFFMGTTSGSVPSYQLQFMQSIRTHHARIIYDINTSAASMASVIDAYARAGIRVLLCANFYARLPSTAEAQNVATWAKAYGPGGTFWVGKSYPANTTVNRIEFGHETSYSYQFPDYSLRAYAPRAQTYALRFKDAQVATKAANPNVGLLAIGDNAVNQDAWVVNMFKAVPDLGSRAAGWTIHPYGPNWKTRIDSTVSSTKAAGSPDLPIWVTEWGLSTDNGRCLDDNYGYGKCLTYAQAASTLHAALTGMLSTYGSRLGAFFLYQTNDQAATGRQTGREYYFGALQQLGAAKGAYTTEVKADLAAHP